MYKTVVKGLKIKSDLSINNTNINGNKINLETLETDEVKLEMDKSRIIRKFMKLVSGYELVPLIKTYYKTKNVAIDFNKLSITGIDNMNNMNNMDTKGTESEYDGLISNIIKNSIKINEIEGLVKLYEKHKVIYYQFQLQNKLLSQISLETDYCNFSISTIDNNMALKLKVDIKTAKKLYELQNILTNICRKKRNTIVNTRMGNEIHVYGHKYDDEMECDYDEICESMTLKVHLKDENNDRSNKLKKILTSIYPTKNKIKVICSGYFWTDISKTKGGVKFLLNDIKQKTYFDLI